MAKLSALPRLSALLFVLFVLLLASCAQNTQNLANSLQNSSPVVEATIAGTLPPIPVPETNSAYIQPVAAEILDFFRPPAHIGGSGNRGWEYGTTSGTQIVAAADGQVHFAGKIGKSSYVSINHPDGLRTTYSHVADITVKKNQSVSKGQLLASTSEVAFHFGVRVDKNYLDPAEIFTTGTLEIFHLLVPATSNR